MWYLVKIHLLSGTTFEGFLTDEALGKFRSAYQVRQDEVYTVCLLETDLPNAPSSLVSLALSQVSAIEIKKVR